MDENNNDYKNLLLPFLDKHEDFKENPYVDNNGYTTVGHGFNLDDVGVSGLIRTYGKDPEKIRNNEDIMDRDTADKIRNIIIDKNERNIKQIMPSFDQLKPNEQAALSSKYYQLPKNFKKLVPYANDPNMKLDLMKEMVLQNINNPGVLKRNLEGAELYGGPQDFVNMFKVFDPEIKSKILKSLNKIENPNTRQEVLDKYKHHLELIPQKQEFPILQKIFKP